MSHRVKEAVAFLLVVLVFGTIIIVGYTDPSSGYVDAVVSYRGGIAALVVIQGLMDLTSTSVSVSNLNVATGSMHVASEIVAVGNATFVDFASIDPDYVEGTHALGFASPVVVYTNLDYSGVCNGDYFVSISLIGTWSWFKFPTNVTVTITPDVCK